MKKIIETIEVEGEGLQALMGKKVTLFCMNYFYTGTLIGVNTDCVLLEDPAIIYDTGAFTGSSYSDCQSLQVKEFYVRINAIEAFGILK